MNAHADPAAFAAADRMDHDDIASALSAVMAIASYLVGNSTISTEDYILKTLQEVAQPFGLVVRPKGEDLPLLLDRDEADEARCRAQRGEFEDCAIHLGRALPPAYAPIADRLQDALRAAR